MDATWVRRPQADTSVVFVHGILSSGELCWRHGSGAYWPELLKDEPDLRSLGIYVFSYQTGVFSGSYRLSDVVDALKERMRLDGVTESQRIIFVCHSMGGLVVRKFIVERAVELVEAVKEIGLFLVASPSLGSTYADWLKPLARLLRHSQADALCFVRNNEWLADLDKDFKNLKEGGKLRIKGKELVEHRFVVLPRILWRQVVEPFAGAVYFGEQYKVADSDHFSIAKPKNKEAIQHRLLIKFIQDMLDAPAPSRPPSARVLVDVAVDPDDMPSMPGGHRKLEITYAMRHHDGRDEIEPDSDYLAAVREGRPIESVDYGLQPFPVRVPALRVRVINNTDGRILINRVALTVERSEPVAEPFLLVVDHRRPPRHILVVNEGSGESGPCKIRFKLLPMFHPEEPSLDDLPYEVTTEGFDRSWLADLSPALASEGPRLNSFDGLIETLGIGGTETSAQGTSRDKIDDRREPLLFSEAQVIGCLESSTSGRILFKSSVHFDGAGGFLPASSRKHKWDVMLPTEGGRFETVIGADAIIPAGESAELTVKVGTKRPSRHRVSVRVVYNQDCIASSRPLDVRIFVPRSSYDEKPWEWLYR